MIFFWGLCGVVVLVGLIISVKMLRRGLTSLDDDRARHYGRIHDAERQIQDDVKNMSRAEHLRVAEAGVADLLRLAGNPPGFTLNAKGPLVVLRTPKGPWRMAFGMRERVLKSSGKVVLGGARWHLSGFGLHEHFDDLADLMCSLNRHLRGEVDVEPEPTHLARRMARRPARKVPGVPASHATHGSKRLGHAVGHAVEPSVGHVGRIGSGSGRP